MFTTMRLLDIMVSSNAITHFDLEKFIMNLFNPAKTVKMTLVGVDGNIFVVFGTFRCNARRQGWTSEEINKVIDEAKTGDYDNALCVILAHCDESEIDYDEE